MSLRGCGKVIKIFISFIIISKSITIAESRNIQDQNVLHPSAVNGGTNLVNELKEKLNYFLSSTSEDSKNNEDPKADSETQPNSIDMYESTKTIPENENFQYRHHATPHPTLQNDGLGYDYEDIDDNVKGDSYHDLKNEDGKTNDETGTDKSTEKSKDEKGELDKEAFIPDCDIPPYPDRLRRTRRNFEEEDDEETDNLDKEGPDVNGGTENAGNTNDSSYKQKKEDELIEDLSDGPSGDNIMTSENMKKTEIESTVNDLGSIKAEDNFLKKLQELRNSLGNMLNDDAPLQSDLRNMMREVSEVLENRFGEVEKMHKEMRVRDLIGRKQVKKIQDYHEKTTEGSPDDKDNVLLEVKKARKRLKLLTKNNDEDLMPDYIEVMQELISMLKKAKNVVRGIKDEANHNERLDDPTNSSAMGTVTDETPRDQIKMENSMEAVDSKLENREREYEEQVLRNKLRNLKRSKKLKNIDTFDSNSVEDVGLPNAKEDLKNRLRNHLRKQLESRNDGTELEGYEFGSMEDLEMEMTKKQRKKKERKDKKDKRRKKGSFGYKQIEDL